MEFKVQIGNKHDKHDKMSAIPAFFYQCQDDYALKILNVFSIFITNSKIENTNLLHKNRTESYKIHADEE